MNIIRRGLHKVWKRTKSCCKKVIKYIKYHKWDILYEITQCILFSLFFLFVPFMSPATLVLIMIVLFVKLR